MVAEGPGAVQPLDELLLVHLARQAPDVFTQSKAFIINKSSILDLKQIIKIA
jgi:hypothetical protein